MSRDSSERWLPGRRMPKRDRVRHNPPTMRIDLAIMCGAFVAASLLAGALGAVNLGTALAFGQIAFAIAAVLVVVRR